MDIGIRSDDVRTKAAQFETTGQELYEAMKSYLDTVINSELPELWQGSGSEAYVLRYNELLPSFNAISQLITDVSAGIVANANFYDEADSQAALANSK